MSIPARPTIIETNTFATSSDIEPKMGKFVDKNFEMASVRKMPIQVEMPANIIFPAACILSSIGLELSHSTLTALPKERVASLIIITMRFTVVRVEFYSNKMKEFSHHVCFRLEQEHI